MDREGGERRWKEGLDWNPATRKKVSHSQWLLVCSCTLLRADFGGSVRLSALLVSGFRVDSISTRNT